MATNTVEIISTCLVTMESHDSYGISRVELTPWDLQLLLVDPIQKGVLFYKPPTLEHEGVIDHLKTSLSRALDFFPPLAGRLAMTKNDVDNTTLFHVDCNNAGAHFAHAKAHGVYVRDILNSTHTPKYVREFFPLNGISNFDGVTEPLLGVQVTELVDGFFVAGTMSHCVVDGTSFWHFMNSWSEISRDSDKITKFPSFERNIPGIFPENLPIPIPSIELERIHNRFSPPPMLERVFHFSRENLSKLKARANFEAGTDNISSFQSLLAHVWRSVQRCRVADQDLEVICFLLIGTRGRLGLPTGYFGNAIHVATVHTKVHDLVNEGIGTTALAINNVISIQTKEEAMNILEDLVEDPLILEKPGILLKNGFLISSCPRHTVYETDFGWGKAVAVRSGPAQKNDGKITLFPGTERGGIDVELCLAPETLIAMGDDAEFMDAVTFLNF